jgi:hypothetical protein
VVPEKKKKEALPESYVKKRKCECHSKYYKKIKRKKKVPGKKKRTREYPAQKIKLFKFYFFLREHGSPCSTQQQLANPKSLHSDPCFNFAGIRCASP